MKGKFIRLELDNLTLHRALVCDITLQGIVVEYERDGGIKQYMFFWSSIRSLHVLKERTSKHDNSRTSSSHS